MSPKTVESCTYHFHSWKPFSKTLDYDGGVHSKRQCRADRATANSCSIPIETVVDMSKLSLFEEKRENLRLIGGGKRRRRRGSRSVSGRSSDRSRRRCCSVGASAAYGTCSDFPVAVGTDSSGELFVNGGGGGDIMHWMMDGSSEVMATTTTMMRSLRKEKEAGERESNLNLQSGGNFEGLGNESGYGSEPGYRGDAEFGYGDEFDEEEDDQRVSFWGDEFGALSRMEKVGENTLQKVHHRCRRRKQDCRMVIP